MNRLNPAGSHELCACLRVIAVGHVWHRAHRGLSVSRLDEDRQPTCGGQLTLLPSRQRESFQSDPLEGTIGAGKESKECVRLAYHPRLFDHSTDLINHANRVLFQREVHFGKVIHGRPFSMFVAVGHQPRSHILTGAAAIVSMPRLQSPLLSGKFWNLVNRL